MRKILYNIALIFIFFLNAGSQEVKYIIPDSGYQGTNFPITIIGSGTEWMVSSYFQIFFDSTGVSATYNSKVNDTTLTGTVYIDGKAVTIPRGIYVLDVFNNSYTKMDALRILLTLPVIPTPLLPPNYSENQLQDVTLLWDSNSSATSFRIQVNTDSLFVGTAFFFDTLTANTPLHIRPDFLELGQKYYWRVNASNALGTSGWSAVFSFRVRTTGVNQISSEIPPGYKLMNNYPNPFNPFTRIRFAAPKAGPVSLNIYDITGRKISELINRSVQAGIYEIIYDASELPSGIYFVHMQADGFSAVNKIALVK